jgi:hypothetical protein
MAEQDIAKRAERIEAHRRHTSLHGDVASVKTNKGPSLSAGPQKRFIPLRFRLRLDTTSNNFYTLVMYINPQQMSLKMQQKITREQTIAGWVEFHWGEDLISISCDAVSGAFQDPKTGLLLAPFSDGYGRNRTDSPAWKKFEELAILFKNNGYVWTTGMGTKPNGKLGEQARNKSLDRYYGDFNQPGYPMAKGELTLEYDGRIYPGFFENFSWKESADSPYMISFNFSYKAYREDAAPADANYASASHLQAPSQWHQPYTGA